MGKTKTAILTGDQEEIKSSEELYKEKKARQEAEKAKKEALHVPGMKGGQKIKIIEAEEPETKAEEKKEEEKKNKNFPENIKIRSKKYVEAKAKINKANQYKLAEAIKIVKETSYSKFDGTMEMHLVVKKQGISAHVSLPFSTGKQKKIEVASEETIEKLKNGKIDFDVLLATADMMPKLVSFARILGPKGLMPNPKNGTVIKSVKDAEKFGGNSITLKTEKEAPLIHTSFGKVSQKDEELIKNAEKILDSLGGTKQIIRAFIKSTMSPSVKINL